MIINKKKLNKNEKRKTNFLISFENEIKKIYEKGNIKGPIHLSGNNENQLIQIFKKIKKDDWIISNWRNHYHALLHGIPKKILKRKILQGKSMSINFKKYNFYSSSIVGGGLPIALGLAMGVKLKKTKKKIWVFVGDMTYETGVFYECYKYAKNFNLPVNFVVEDNEMSTNTPTKLAWGAKIKKLPGVIYYKYKRKYPHHGTGNWVLF